MPASASSHPGSFHAPYWDPYDAGGLTGAEYIEQVLFKKLTDPADVAAVFVEPIQGEGGYIVPPAGWLAELRALCDRHQILLVLDEVQSGIGRTGTMWACEHDGVEPDILCVGKGLASGLPLAGHRGPQRADGLGARWSWLHVRGKSGRLRGRQPRRCSSSSQASPTTPPRSAAHLLSALSELSAARPFIEQVRGRGLMIGIDAPDHDAAEALQEACFRRGLLTLTCGERTLRLAPPLVVTVEQADIAVSILDDAIASLRTAS